MIDKTKLKTAQEWIEKLANGINPLTSEPVKENDIVNNVHISRCLFFVSEMLKKVKMLYLQQKYQNQILKLRLT